MSEKPSIEGRYANYLEVGANLNELVLDFGQSYADTGNVTIHTRIITSPAYASDFLNLLRSSLSDYERRYGRRGGSPHE